MANSDGGELNEHIPLKSTKKKSCFQYLFEGPRFITTAFTVFTIVLTIALLVQIYYGDFQIVPHGSVATDSRECSTIGTNILKQGGNAIDSAIASAFCLSVVNPHTCGLDAGGYILIYNHRNRKDATTIDFSNVNSNVPKLLVGLIKAHEFYGQLPWEQLVQPAADLAMKGFFVSKQLELSISNGKMQKIFGSIQAGNKMRQEELANFLRTIAEVPDRYSQLKMININTTNSKKGVFKNYNIYAPDSSLITQYLFSGLERVENLNLTENEDYTYQLANLSLELYKDFDIEKKFKEGTSTNVAVMDLNDYYVSLVMGYSQPFGSRNITETGYIRDLPNALPNVHLPIILVNRDFICAKRLVFGIGNLATAIQIITGLVIGNDNSSLTIEKPRFVMLPNYSFGLEEDHSQRFSDKIVDNLNKLGNSTYLHEPYLSCNIVEKISDDLNSHSDSRGGGFASRF